ncbi:lantibiotic ABC transporter permease [Streptococcus gallolyticus]|uniref:lantibiotic ABC transporter permease n=1 Tax=Streptococcus gallolyticus TaxID=315405 RepID=UPI000884CA6E|nr:lantibiotic ABC transporter permease [Streptococcus gallolyticus]SDJ71202.1 ABC-2 type transport system permease protein [Streptococcus gallolyticus]SDL21420.1 ABC-2 type transport system permease protein [Streptococcus gallolyticus]
MNKVLQSEMLKRKKGIYGKLCFIIPLISIFIAFLLCGPSLLESFSIYWWEALFLFTLIGLFFTYDQKEEEGAGHFQNIILGQLTYRIQIAKIILTVKDLILASFFFLLILYLVSFLFSGIMMLNIIRDIEVLFFILVASLWNIPMLYYLSTWVNNYVLLVLNALACLLLAPFLAQTSFWYLFLYTYHYKISQVLIHLKPSGDLENLNVSHPFSVLFIASFLSIILFGLFIKLLWEEKRV